MRKSHPIIRLYYCSSQQQPGTCVRRWRYGHANGGGNPTPKSSTTETQNKTQDQAQAKEQERDRERLHDGMSNGSQNKIKRLVERKARAMPVKFVSESPNKPGSKLGKPNSEFFASILVRRKLRYPIMLKKLIAVFLSYILLAPMAPLAQAGSLSSDAVLGAVIGSAAGAAIGSTTGDRNGAIIGAAIGGAIGTSISTRPIYREPRHIQERIVYMPPPGWRHRHRHGGEYVYYARPYYPDRYDERYYRRYYDD